VVRAGILTIRTDQVIGLINPNIFGHFIEHLGRCIYPGIWVGGSSRIPNLDGLRKDFVQLFKAVNPPVIRWPGGCFADLYHWEDGVGPFEKRPRRKNIWWGGEEANEFGTDEFIRLCRNVNAEPYICLNVGSGSPAEALSWLEYCNSSGGSKYCRLRAENGSLEPYMVKYWGVGNENWGCGGSFDPVYYAWEYRRFANYLKRADPSIQLIACGHTSRDWNYRFMENLRNHINLIDHLSIHYYFRGFGGDVNFTDDDYFNLMLDVQNLEYQIQQAINVVDYFSEGRKYIGIIVDEWGTWHPQATVETGLYQQNTLRDALLAAAVLNLYIRYSRKVVMANLAQTVNVLQSLFLTKGDKTIVTPTYHAFTLYKEHMGNRALRVEAESPIIKETHPKPGEQPPRFGRERTKALQALDASASISKDGKHLVLTLLNLGLEDLEVEIALTGGKVITDGGLSLLTADSLHKHNEFENPDSVKPREDETDIKGRVFEYTAPKHSINRFVFKLNEA
jgi:alpha-N-arabinofuranosidase